MLARAALRLRMYEKVGEPPPQLQLGFGGAWRTVHIGEGAWRTVRKN